MTLIDRPHAAGAHPGTGRVRVSGGALGLMVAVGVLIAGCSGTEGADPTGATASVTSSGVTASARPATGSAGPQPSSGAATTGYDGSGTGAPWSPTTTAFTSVAETTTRPSASTPSTPKPSGTGVIGTLDAGSVRWFTVMCTGLSSADTSTAHQATGDLAARRTQAADVFGHAAAAYRTMDTELAGLPAPAIPAGQKLHQALLQAAPAMADAAEQGARAVTKATDEVGLTAAIDLADDEVSAARAPLSDFAEAIAAPALAMQLEKIDACRPLFT